MIGIEIYQLAVNMFDLFQRQNTFSRYFERYFDNIDNLILKTILNEFYKKGGLSNYRYFIDKSDNYSKKCFGFREAL